MPRKKSTQPTLEDIAARSGVSLTTVSRVINQSHLVSEDATLKVRQAMEELGVEPKRPKSRTGILLFIVPEFTNPSTDLVLAGAQEEAERMGLGLLVMTVAQYPERNKPNLKVLKQFPFDGVIVTHSELTPERIFELSNRSDFPLVVYGRSLDTPHVHCIDIDRDNAYYQATKYLITLGHQRIAFLSGPVEWYISQQRLKAIQRALAEANLALDPDLHRWSVPTIDEAARIATTVLNLPIEKRPTAILGFNDLVAFGAMSAARSLGLRIPDDVSVIGSDDIYLASHTNPPLTSISQPHYRAGQLAVQKISNSLSGAQDDTEGVTMLSCPLAVRESTGPCPSQTMS